MYQSSYKYHNVKLRENDRENQFHRMETVDIRRNKCYTIYETLYHVMKHLIYIRKIEAHPCPSRYVR
jgi:hypothetical protein